VTTTTLTPPAPDTLPGYRRDPWYGTRALVSLPYPTDQLEKVALLASSIGPQVIDWAEGRAVDPESPFGELLPGLIDPQSGEPWRFTAGQKRFLILWYRYTPAGRWVYRRGCKRGAKGTGKDPFGAAWCNIEFVGPSQLTANGRGGWHGERHAMPLVQIASNSEAQSKDVLRVANAMWSKDARAFYGIDVGETRTILKQGGGRQEVITASEQSAEGDPATAVFLNETHHMTESSGGHRVARVVRRNVGKSPAYLQARVLDGTNAHAQGSDSIGERTYEAWRAQATGKTQRVDILYDSIEAPPDTDLFDDASRREGLRAAYADAPWADLDRLDGEVLDPETPVADSIRYYLNGLAAAEDAWIDPRKFDALSRPDIVIEDGEQIAMFLDCSKSGDATGLVGVRISDGHVFVLGCWQRPLGKAGEGWLADRQQVDGAVRFAFERFRVVWFGVDPSPAKDDDTEALYWMPLCDAWHRDFHKKLKVWATGGVKTGHSVLFDMRIKTPGGIQRNQQFTQAAMQTAQDIDEHGTLSWDGDPRLQTHAHQAKRRTNPWGVSLGKVTRDSNKHVDLAVCMVGGRMGRRIALNSGKVRRRTGGSTGKAVF
jgi:hypothetical protein